VMEFTCAALNWTNKVLEISAFRFVFEKGQSGEDGEEDGPPRFYIQASVNETDASVYEWSSTEELTPYDVPANGVQGNPYSLAAPTGVSVTTSSATAVVGADGVTIPRALVSWTAPADVRAVQIQLQYRVHGTSTWIDAGVVSSAVTSAYISGIVSTLTYDYQVRSLRSNGATSAWAQQLSQTAANVLSTIGSGTLPSPLQRLNTVGTGSPTASLGATAQVGTGASITISLVTGTGTLAAGILCQVDWAAVLALAPNGVVAANGQNIPGLGWAANDTYLQIACEAALAPTTAYEMGYSFS
jgi:hypothetical protein